MAIILLIHVQYISTPITSQPTSRIYNVTAHIPNKHKKTSHTSSTSTPKYTLLQRLVIDRVGVTVKKLIARQGKGFSSNINELNATAVPTVGFLSALSTPFLCICKKNRHG